MKPPSEMTVHELVELMLDIVEHLRCRKGSLVSNDDIASLFLEAAERLELAADGQGVGPTAIKSGS